MSPPSCPPGVDLIGIDVLGLVEVYDLEQGREVREPSQPALGWVWCWLPALVACINLVLCMYR